MYNGNTLNLDRLMEKLDAWGMTVTEDMDPAAAEKYVPKRFRWRLPELLPELYLVAAREGKITALKKARKLPNEQQQWTPCRLPPRGGDPSSFSMMAGRSACRTGGTSEDNTCCSAETWRTGTRVMSSPACSIPSRTPE